MHPAAGLAPCELPVALIGLRKKCLARLPGDDGIDRRIDRVDAVQIGNHDLATRHVAGMNQS